MNKKAISILKMVGGLFFIISSLTYTPPSALSSYGIGTIIGTSITFLAGLFLVFGGYKDIKSIIF